MFEAEICGMFCPTYCTTCDTLKKKRRKINAECCGKSRVCTLLYVHEPYAGTAAQPLPCYY